MYSQQHSSRKGDYFLTQKYYYSTHNIYFCGEIYRVYSFSYFKYGIYKPREVKKNLIKKFVQILNMGFIYKPREVKKSDKETRIFFIPAEVYKSHI